MKRNNESFPENFRNNSLEWSASSTVWLRKLWRQVMEEEYSIDPAQLLEAASEFAHRPGSLSDSSAQEFLARFPLPAVISALQTSADYPGLENAVVTCLERIFKTKHGASLIPHFMPVVLVGLGAGSQNVRHLACVTVSCLLSENSDRRISIQLVRQYGVYPLLLSCLVDGDDQVAAASADAIKTFASYPEGMGIVFPTSTNEATHLENLAQKCSPLVRVRLLALIVRLFSISSSVASEISKSNLLNLLEAEVRNTDDSLVILSVLELLSELAEVQHSAEFVSRTSLFQLLCSIISEAAEMILRSRAMVIAGRLLSKENAFEFIDDSSYTSVLSAIDGKFEFLEDQDSDACECALEALGQIGSSFHGATLLLSTSPLAAKHVVDAAFDRQHHGKQLAALHALGNIAGETRVGSNIVLNNTAEENLKRLIYEKASNTAKLTPSGLLLSILQQDSEIRTAGYRLITGLVARPWCLVELISQSEIISILANVYTETKKIGMESRHRCCEAIYRAFLSSGTLSSDPAFADIAGKLQEAIRRGPYLATKQSETQPDVMTADRF